MIFAYDYHCLVNIYTNIFAFIPLPCIYLSKHCYVNWSYLFISSGVLYVTCNCDMFAKVESGKRLSPRLSMTLHWIPTYYNLFKLCQLRWQLALNGLAWISDWKKPVPNGLVEQGGDLHRWAWGGVGRGEDALPCGGKKRKELKIILFSDNLLVKNTFWICILLSNQDIMEIFNWYKTDRLACVIILTLLNSYRFISI